ncbi:hypothetical protein XFF6992_280115 [Xanthomonas citri pv. fuscans]|nr:hypothetical protein XFF6992_280115 [Xanthomonas citri pv. fuscans]SOO33038.1 hypothetical protein XFF6994_2590006 [Xanthomonas citri pv. fuscans]
MTGLADAIDRLADGAAVGLIVGSLYDLPGRIRHRDRAAQRIGVLELDDPCVTGGEQAPSLSREHI